MHVRFHRWRRPRSFDKIRDNLTKVRVGPLVRVTSSKFWMKIEVHSRNGSVENWPPVCEKLVHLPTRTERKDPWLGIVWQVMLMHERKTRRTIEGGDNTSWTDLGSHKTLTTGSNTLTHTLMVDQYFLSTMRLSMSAHCHWRCFSHNNTMTIQSADGIWDKLI